MTKEQLIVGNKYWVDGRALKTNLAELKYVGSKYVIVERTGDKEEEWHTLSFFLEWALEE